ncbi:MAG: hypothetical protein KAY00_05165, partial [Agitococcus sp.]|nr:hypothetical protein [Agitococcus sp.]
RFESTALSMNLPFTERFAVAVMLMTENDIEKISNLGETHKIRVNIGGRICPILFKETRKNVLFT